MTITETRPSIDWDKERRKKRRRRLDSVDAALVLVAAVLLGVGSHLFTNSLFRSRSEAVPTVVTQTVPLTTVGTTGTLIALALAPGIDGALSDHGTMTVTGTATPGAEVNIGGLRSTARRDGSWTIAVLLKPGVNDLAIEVNGSDGSYTVHNFTITYKPSATTVPAAPTVGVPTTPAAVSAALPVDTKPATTAARRPATTVPTTVPTTPAPTTSVPVDTEPKP